MIVLTGARIFDGTQILEGQAIVIEGAAIRAVLPARMVPNGVRHVHVEGLLAPGFIDIQVNGGGGVLFNDEPTPKGIAAIGAAHRVFGTTGFLPTLITDAPGRMVEAMVSVRTAIKAKSPGVLGIHLEGPFISVERAGVHDPLHIRPIAEKDVARIVKPTGGRTLVTLAPEVVPPETIATLVAAGVIVAAGHTAAMAEEVVAARAAGLTGFTHLFNAMPPLAGRDPGPVGVAFDDPAAWASIIVDLHHVAPVALRAALAARGWQKMILVTDAMPTVGSTINGFALPGHEVTREGTRLSTEDGGLAGAHLDMASAVRNAVHELGQPLEAALHMASGAPADFLGLGDMLGRITPGFAADIVLLDDDLGVSETWIGGVASGEEADR